MRPRELGFGSLRPWPPQKCFLTQRMGIYGISTILDGWNTYLAFCARTRKGIFIDFVDQHVTRWGRALESLNVEVTAAAVTHVDTQSIEVLSLMKKMSFVSSLKVYAHAFEKLPPSIVDENITDGMIVDVGDLSFKCLHTPGASQGHCVFYEKTEGVAFTGDILARGGRMMKAVPDPKSNQESLGKLVREVSEISLLFPAHYGLTTMGAERRVNPNLMGLQGPTLLIPAESYNQTSSYAEKNRKTKRWKL